MPKPSETPRTDAEILILKTRDEWIGQYDEGIKFVHPDFARALERELAEAVARIEALEAGLRDALPMLRSYCAGDPRAVLRVDAILKLLES